MKEYAYHLFIKSRIPETLKRTFLFFCNHRAECKLFDVVNSVILKFPLILKFPAIVFSF